jgi:hypothetical protein
MMTPIVMVVLCASPYERVRLEAIGWTKDGRAFVVREQREDGCDAIAVTDAKTAERRRYRPLKKYRASCPELPPNSEYERWVIANPLAPATADAEAKTFVDVREEVEPEHADRLHLHIAGKEVASWPVPQIETLYKHEWSPMSGLSAGGEAFFSPDHSSVAWLRRAWWTFHGETITLSSLEIVHLPPSRP